MNDEIIIYECLRGSHAQGVTTETSDKDYFKIILPNINAVLGLENRIGSQHIKDGIDVREITLKEFLIQALTGRSTELEVLFAKAEHQIYIHPIGQELLDFREKLVSQRLFKSLLGFYKNQKHRMFTGNGGRRDDKLGYDPKMAAHCIRAIWQAINLKETGRVDIYIYDSEAANLILSLKNKEIPLYKLVEITDTYERRFDSAKSVNIPENPDYEWANNFLIRTNREVYI